MTILYALLINISIVIGFILLYALIGGLYDASVRRKQDDKLNILEKWIFNYADKLDIYPETQYGQITACNDILKKIKELKNKSKKK